MFHTILVPLDGSQFSEYALPPAQALAQRAEAALHLALVHMPVYSSYVEGTPILDPELDTTCRANEQTYLEAIQQNFTFAGGARPKVSLLDGPVAETLGSHVSRVRANLIVMTTHGRGGLARFWLGSVADALVRHTHVPVLLIRPGRMTDATLATQQPVRRILIALDGSPLAEQVIAPALTLGSAFDVEYSFVQVVDPIVVSAPFMVDPARHEREAVSQRQHHAQQYLERIIAPVRREGYRVTARVLVDSQPALAILNEAHEQGADVIALATHGRGGVRRLLLGSVADKVLRGADRAVLVYRPQAKPAGV